MDADQTAASASQYELTFGSDDFIGTHTINFISCNSCSAGSDATVSTVISYQEILPVPAVQSLDTVKVGSPPGNPNIVYDSSNYIVYTDSSQYTLQWYIDTTSLANCTDPTDTISKQEIITLFPIIIMGAVLPLIQFLQSIVIQLSVSI